MPTITHDDATIYYEEFGDGYPILLLSPGGLDSTISSWDHAAINPLTCLANDFRLIAMDQRNAGRSTGPFVTDRPWDAYRDDQLAVVDHLGLTTFHVMGCCIGCSYGLKLAHDVPKRVTAAVLQQPIGIIKANKEGWIERCETWASSRAQSREDLDDHDGKLFSNQMFSNDFVVSMTRDEVTSIKVPICVMPGIDDVHPTEIGREVGHLVEGAQIIEPWKESPEQITKATSQVREFLLRHTQKFPATQPEI